MKKKSYHRTHINECLWRPDRITDFKNELITLIKEKKVQFDQTKQQIFEEIKYSAEIKKVSLDLDYWKKQLYQQKNSSDLAKKKVKIIITIENLVAVTEQVRKEAERDAQSEQEQKAKAEQAQQEAERVSKEKAQQEERIKQEKERKKQEEQETKEKAEKSQQEQKAKEQEEKFKKQHQEEAKEREGETKPTEQKRHDEVNKEEKVNAPTSENDHPPQPLVLVIKSLKQMIILIRLLSMNKKLSLFLL